MFYTEIQPIWYNICKIINIVIFLKLEIIGDSTLFVKHFLMIL